MTKKILSLLFALQLVTNGVAYAQFPPSTIGSVRPVEATENLNVLDECTPALYLFGLPTVGFSITGTFTATITFQVSGDLGSSPSNWTTVNVVPVNGTTPVTTASAPGNFSGVVQGMSFARACATAYSSGTAVVVVRATVGGGGGAGGGGGGSVTQFQEDNPHTTGDVGIQILGVRNDAGTTLATTTGDYIPLSMDSTGAVRVSGGAAGGTSSNFGAAFPTAGTAVGFTDGTNMVSGRAVDADTGAGTFNVPTFNLVFRTNGTPVEAGTSTNPFNVVFPSTQNVTVATALPAGDNNIGNIDIASSVALTVGTFPDNEPFNLAQVNGNTISVGNGASGTGVQRVTIANDSTGTLAVTQATASNLNAQVVGVAAFDAPASGNPVLQGWFGSSAIPTAASANGDVVRPWASLFGAPNVIMRDSVGDSAMDDTNNALRVNIVAGAGSGGTAITDDAAFTVASTSFTPVGGTYKSTLDLVDDNDGGAFAMTQRRAIHGSIRRESDGVEMGVAATAPLSFRPSDGTNFLSFSSDSTHGAAAESAGPQNMVEAAVDVSANTPVDDGDAVRATGDNLGRLLVAGPCDRSARVRSVTTVTDGSSTSAIGAQGANIIVEVWDVIIANTSATAVTVDLRDGTAGSVMATFPVPANTAGVVHRFAVPVSGTANTAVAVDPSAAASSIITTLSGCKVK